MANYGTRQNNDKDNDISINTRCYQFMNSNSEIEPSTLNVGAWNDMMSLRINPALEPSKRTENKIFDYERSVSTSLTREKAELMLYKIKKFILPELENGNNKTVGVQVGGDSVLCVGCCKNKNGDMIAFLALHKSLNPNTKKPEMSMFYEFKSEMSIDDYDHNTGTYNIDTKTYSEINLFTTLLKSFIIAGSGFVGHSVRWVNRWDNEKMNGTLSNIANKVGATVGGGYNRSRSGSNNIFSSPAQNNTNSSASNAVENEPLPFDNIEDLDSMLND